MLKDVYSSDRVAITQVELNKILRHHEMYVAKQGGMRAILRNADLTRLVLANRNLSGADLSGATLVGANLYGTNLSSASLYCADLRECDLRNARLERADLRGAAFKGADLAFASLDHADIRAATMMYVGKNVSMMSKDDDGQLGAVDFSNCSLRNVSFDNARLDNANFTDALLCGAIFRGTKLAGARFDGAVLIGVNLAEIELPPETFANCLTSPLPSANERANAVFATIKAHHQWIVTGGKEGMTGVIDGEDLRPIAQFIKGLKLSGLSARGVNAVAVDFSDCELQAVKFSGADLRAACFANADLSGTDFDNAKLAHATFRNARIHDLALHNGQTLQARAAMAHGTSSQFANANVKSQSFLSGLLH